MPVIGVPFSCGYGRPQIRYIGIIRGLAQRNKGRKTSYFYSSAHLHGGRENSGTPAGASASEERRHPRVSAVARTRG
jgi:hypothetical protein